MANRSQAARSRRAELEAQRLAQAKKQRQLRIIGTAVGLVVIAVVVGLTIWGINSAETGGEDTPPNATADKKSISLTQSVSGSAPVLEILADFQCPGCKSFHEELATTIDELIDSGSVNILFRQMTFLDSVNTTQNERSSTRAAVGAACADFAGQYIPYSDAVFSNQPAKEGDGYSDTLLRDTIPSTLGITGEALTAFQTCYDNQSTGKFVQGVDDEASERLQAVDSTGTPTYILNGENITSQMSQGRDTVNGMGGTLKDLIAAAS
jgi:protein-disulfide isomerase